MMNIRYQTGGKCFMTPVLWPSFQPENLRPNHQYQNFLNDWLEKTCEKIEHGDIALSECVFAYLTERILFHTNKISWDSVLKELLTDESGYPLAYSKQYGKRLYEFDGQWKQTTVHAIYYHYWILSHYDVSIEPYAALLEQMVQPSG